MTPVLRRIMARRRRRFARAGAVSGIAHPGRDAASGNGPAGAYAAWALLGGLGRPGWSGMYSQNPRGWKTGLAVLRRARNAPRCCCRAGTTRCPIVERRGAMWLAQGWARAGPASAGMCRSRRRAGRKEPVLVRSFLVRKIPARRACSSFRHVAGVTRHVDPGLRSSARNGCSGRHWVGFRVRSGSGLVSAVVWAKPCAFAISRRAAGFARRALCFGCALAACLGFSALDPALPVAFLFRRT